MTNVDVVIDWLLCDARLKERDGRFSMGKSLQLAQSVTATVNLTEINKES